MELIKWEDNMSIDTHIYIYYIPSTSNGCRTWDEPPWHPGHHGATRVPWQFFPSEALRH